MSDIEKDDITEAVNLIKIIFPHHGFSIIVFDLETQKCGYASNVSIPEAIDPINATLKVLANEIAKAN